MPKTLAFVLFALGVCAPSVSHAQTYESVGIRAQGMAGAFVAVADDATASWWNPAGLATSQSFADGIVEVLPPQYQSNSAVWLYRGRGHKPTRSRSCRTRSARVEVGGI